MLFRKQPKQRDPKLQLANYILIRTASSQVEKVKYTRVQAAAVAKQMRKETEQSKKGGASASVLSK